MAPKKAAPKKTKAKRPPLKDIIDIEILIAEILECNSYRKIAKKFRVPLSSLVDYISKSEHSARVREAKQASADICAEMARDVLEQAEGTKEEIMRARELSQYYKWKAAKLAPKQYGDKLDVTTDGEKINATVPNIVVNTACKTAFASSENDVDSEKKGQA